MGNMNEVELLDDDWDDAWGDEYEYTTRSTWEDYMVEDDYTSYEDDPY